MLYPNTTQEQVANKKKKKRKTHSNTALISVCSLGKIYQSQCTQDSDFPTSLSLQYFLFIKDLHFHSVFMQTSGPNIKKTHEKNSPTNDSPRNDYNINFETVWFS